MYLYLKLILILTGFAGLKFGENLFFFYTLWKITNITEFGMIYLCSFCTTGYIAINFMIARIFPSLFSMVLYYIMVVWWGLGIYLFIFSVFYHIINALVILPDYIGVTLVILPAAVLVLYGMLNACVIRQEFVEVRMPELQEPIRVVHLADLHLGAVYHRTFTRRIVNIVQNMNPDVVVITGDLFDGSMNLTPDMIAPFNDLPPHVPILFVLGNHEEVIVGINNVTEVLKNSRITLLRGEQVKVKSANFIGFDDSIQRQALFKALDAEEFARNPCNILLHHAPNEKVEELEEHNVKLTLVGHTHGGQMFPFHVSSWIFSKYNEGLYYSPSGLSHIYVSSGLGTSFAPIRIGSSSTVTCLSLNP